MSGDGSSYRNPAPVGTTVRSVIERGDPYSASEFYDAEVAVLEVVRGDEARGRIRAEGVLAAGHEYLLARLRIAFSSRSRGFGNRDHELGAGMLGAFSEDGRTEYEFPVVFRQPEPSLLGAVVPTGSSREGWLVLEVPEAERRPLLAFKRDNPDGMYALWAYRWFELHEASA